MNRYWKGTTEDGKPTSELVWKFGESTLKSLDFVLEDKNITISLPDNLAYLHAKTASADMSTGKCEIESRYVGFIHNNSKIIVRVDEKTGNIKIEAHSI